MQLQRKKEKLTSVTWDYGVKMCQGLEHYKWKLKFKKHESNCEIKYEYNLMTCACKLLKT
jgi:hypothetical protein